MFSDAQNIIVCELCESANPVRWTCVNCLDDLCDMCKRVHGRQKATRHHEIIPKSKIVENERRLESRCTIHQNICTFYCPQCNDLICTKCVTENHLGHPLQEIEIIHKERRTLICKTIGHIQDLRISGLVERQTVFEKLRREIKSDKYVLRNRISTQTTKLEKAINSASERLLKKVDQFYEVEEMRLSQTCTELNNLKELLEQQTEHVEHLLTSNDTRRFIGDEIDNIKKSLQKITEFQSPKELKRASVVVKKLDFRRLESFIATVQFPSFTIPDQDTQTVTLKLISKFDKLDNLEIIKPIDLHNVWVKDKLSGNIRKWTRTTEKEITEDSDKDEQIITINKSSNAVEAISEDGEAREIRKYLMWRPRCFHVDGDIITLGLVDDKTDFEAGLFRLGQSLKSPRRLWYFLRNDLTRLPEYWDQQAMIIQMKTCGEVLFTFKCKAGKELSGPLYDLELCVSYTSYILSLELRQLRTSLVKRDSTGEIIKVCNLSSFSPRKGGAVCTTSGKVLVLDFKNIVHFINTDLEVISELCLNNINIHNAERLFLDKYDRVWIKGQCENEARKTVFITGLSS